MLPLAHLTKVVPMNRLKYYYEEIGRRVGRRTFMKSAPDVLMTPPVKSSADGPLLLSMVHNRDVIPYLVAVKSFMRFVNVSRVVVVADKSMTATDKQTLSSHIDGVIIRDAAEFERKGVPVGGCWERFIAISTYVGDAYVIQLDADTMSLGGLDSVLGAVQSDTSFTLSTFDLQSKVSVGEVARWAQSHCKGDPHVQLLCESNLVRAAGGDLTKQYIRGCAGFAGFAKNSFSFSDIATLSERMHEALGEKWWKWGTEQFASNYIVSNSEKCLALPHPVYTTPDRINDTTVFVHFIGPLRYYKGLYLKYLEQFLKC